MVSPPRRHLRLGHICVRKKWTQESDWFEAHWEEMQPVTEAKKIALLAYKQNPFRGTRDALRVAKSKAQRTTRRCANDYFQSTAKIQTASDCGHARRMYEGIKTATDPTNVKTAPLKANSGEVITNSSCRVGLSTISSVSRPRTSWQTLPLTLCTDYQSWRS